MRYFKANLDELRTTLFKFFPEPQIQGCLHLHIWGWIKKNTSVVDAKQNVKFHDEYAPVCHPDFDHSNAL